MRQKGSALLSIIVVVVVITLGLFAYQGLLLPKPYNNSTAPTITPLSTLTLKPDQTTHQIDKEKIIEAIADKANDKPSDVVIGVPFVETSSWVAVNAGNKNSGGGAAFIFKKIGEDLELIFSGQECPDKTLIQEKQIPEIALFVISSTGCK